MSKSRNESGTSAISRAASARSRTPAGPFTAYHRLEQRARGVEILRRSWRGEKRRHAGADREVFEVAKLLDLGQRIDAHLPRQVEERLGANAEVGDP